MPSPIKTYNAVINGKAWIVDAAFQFDFTAPAGSVQEVLQNVFNIISTPLGTQPLFRIFGSDQSWIDSPGNIGQMQAKTAFLMAISLWEPRAKVTNMRFALQTEQYLAGYYSLFLELEVNLNAQINQTLFVTPAPAEIWVIDGPITGELGVSQEAITV